MKYGLDTSVLMRLLNKTNDEYSQRIAAYISSRLEEGDTFFISELVVSELYFALQHHYGHTKEVSITALRAIAKTPGFTFSPEAKAALETPDAWRASPGFVDRMIANGYASRGCVTLSCEKDFRKLDFTEIIS